jgi:hypothetical protein
MRLSCQFTPVNEFNTFKGGKSKPQPLTLGGQYRTLRFTARRLLEDVGTTGHIRVCILTAKEFMKNRTTRVAATRCTQLHVEAILPFVLAKEVDLMIRIIEKNAAANNPSETSSICESNIEADLRDVAAHLRRIEESESGLFERKK